MNKETTLHNILYGARLVATIVLIALLHACTHHTDHDGPEPGKTPLRMGNLTIAPQTVTQPSTATTQAGTRATAAAFFRDGEVLSITNKDGYVISYTRWNGTGFDALFTPIYLEDVWTPGQAGGEGTQVELYAQYGYIGIDVYQSTEAGLHETDYIRGPLTVDPAKRTLNCTAMTHQKTQLIIRIAAGEGWKDDADFLSHFAAGIFINTTADYVYPYRQESGTGADLAMTLTAILPPKYILKAAGETIFTLIVPDTSGLQTRTLKLSGDIDPQPGESITINATYDKRGVFGGITATLGHWQEVTHADELPAMTEGRGENEK